MSVDGVSAFPGEPTVISVSDAHGHRDRFESALLTRNADSPGCEAVLVETRGNLLALVRRADGGVDCRPV